MIAEHAPAQPLRAWRGGCRNAADKRANGGSLSLAHKAPRALPPRTPRVILRATSYALHGVAHDARARAGDASVHILEAATSTAQRRVAAALLSAAVSSALMLQPADAAVLDETAAQKRDAQGTETELCAAILSSNGVNVDPDDAVDALLDEMRSGRRIALTAEQRTRLISFRRDTIAGGDELWLAKALNVAPAPSQAASTMPAAALTMTPAVASGAACDSTCAGGLAGSAGWAVAGVTALASAVGVLRMRSDTDAVLAAADATARARVADDMAAATTAAAVAQQRALVALETRLKAEAAADKAAALREAANRAAAELAAALAQQKAALEAEAAADKAAALRKAANRAAAELAAALAQQKAALEASAAKAAAIAAAETERANAAAAAAAARVAEAAAIESQKADAALAAVRSVAQFVDGELAKSAEQATH